MNIQFRTYYALLAGLIIGIDRWTKHVVMHCVPHYKINQFVSIDLVFNRGISFGMFHSDNTIIFAGVNLLIGSVIAILMMHAYEQLANGKPIIGEIFIFAGAISNIADRWLYSGVVDFIACSLQNWHFAVFNVADVFIFCGVMLMIVLEYSQS